MNILKGDSGERRRKTVGCFTVSPNPLWKPGSQAGEVFYIGLFFKALSSIVSICSTSFLFLYLLNCRPQRLRSGIDLSLFGFNLPDHLPDLQSAPKSTFSPIQHFQPEHRHHHSQRQPPRYRDHCPLCHPTALVS